MQAKVCIFFCLKESPKPTALFLPNQNKKIHTFAKIFLNRAVSMFFSSTTLQPLPKITFRYSLRENEKQQK